MDTKHVGAMITHNLSFEKMLVLLYQGNDRWAVTVGEQLFFMGTNEMRELANKVLKIIDGEQINASETN
jgi:hypothetical protein